MGQSASSRGKPSASLEDAYCESAVTMFSATYCGYCKVAKRTLDEALQGQGQHVNVVQLDKVRQGEQLAKDLEAFTGQNTVSII